MDIRIKRGFPFEWKNRLWQWLNSPREPNFDDFGPNRDEFSFHLARRIRTEYTWGIWLGDDLVGYLAFVAQSPMCGQFHGLVIAPAHRMKGIGGTAVDLAIAELAEDGFRKFIAWTFADNQRIEHLFRRRGFQQEGYISGATKRGGEPLDIRVLCFPGKEIACPSVAS